MPAGLQNVLIVFILEQSAQLLPSRLAVLNIASSLRQQREPRSIRPCAG